MPGRAGSPPEQRCQPLGLSRDVGTGRGSWPCDAETHASDGIDLPDDLIPKDFGGVIRQERGGEGLEQASTSGSVAGNPTAQCKPGRARKLVEQRKDHPGMEQVVLDLMTTPDNDRPAWFAHVASATASGRWSRSSTATATSLAERLWR